LEGGATAVWWTSETSSGKTDGTTDGGIGTLAATDSRLVAGTGGGMAGIEEVSRAGIEANCFEKKQNQLFIVYK
jgi:hypothetical protein